MILLNILFLLLLFIIIFKKNIKEKFINISDTENKNEVDKKYKNVFLKTKYWRVLDPNFNYQSSSTNIKLGYLPNELKEILNPLVRNIKTNNFVEIKDKTRLDINIYLELIDKYISQITNNIYYDLFKIRKHKRLICPNLNACPISIIDKKLSKFEENDTFYKFTIIIILNIGNKEVNYVFELVIIYNKKNKIDYLISLDIIGNVGEDISNLPILSSTPVIKYYDSSILENQELYNIKKKHTNSLKNKMKLNNQDESDYKCFGSYGNNQLECESDFDLYFKPKKRGVWDKNCKENDECPFFNKNKNYKNNMRGGCVEGKCEMPLGIESIGQRYYNIDSVPFCYNCPDGKFDCCKDQKSPDYIFENDIFQKIFDKKK